MALPLLGLLGSFAARKSIETVARYIMRDGAKKTLARLVKEFPGKNSRSINTVIKNAEKQIADAKKMYDKVKKGDVPTTGKFVQTKITPKSTDLASRLIKKSKNLKDAEKVTKKSTAAPNKITMLESRSGVGYIPKGQQAVNLTRQIGKAKKNTGKVNRGKAIGAIGLDRDWETQHHFYFQALLFY